MKITRAPRELHEGEISENAADCLYQWSKGVDKHILNLLLEVADECFETGLFDAIGDDPVYSEQGIRNRLSEVALSWSKILCNPLDPSAPSVGRRLSELVKSYRDADTSVFWRGYLGQLIFYRDGFPTRMLTRVEAVSVLRTMTRNIVGLSHSGLIEMGGLPGAYTIDRAAVVREWERRNGLVVGNARMLRFG